MFLFLFLFCFVLFCFVLFCFVLFCFVLVGFVFVFCQTDNPRFSFSSVSVYFHHIYHTNEQYKENIGGENQKEQSSK